MLLRQRFLALTRSAVAGELDARSKEPTVALALALLLLDQYPCLVWCATPRPIAGDLQALAMSLRAGKLSWLETETEQTSLPCSPPGSAQLWSWAPARVVPPQAGLPPPQPLGRCGVSRSMRSWRSCATLLWPVNS